MFTAAKDVETAIEIERGFVINGNVEDSSRRSSGQEHTPPEVLNQLRKRIIRAFGKQTGRDLIAKSRAMYHDVDDEVRMCCSISKRYPRGTYWYAYHPHWDRFLAEGSRGFFILGCVDRDVTYALPRAFMQNVMHDLYVTEMKDTGRMYWHVHLEEGPGDEISFLVGKAGQKVPISTYAVGL